MTTAGRVAPLLRNFLRHDYGKIDACIPKMLKILHERGASECWHKHSTFAEHLVGVWRIMTLWGQRHEAARVSSSDTRHRGCVVCGGSCGSKTTHERLAPRLDCWRTTLSAPCPPHLRRGFATLRTRIATVGHYTLESRTAAHGRCSSRGTSVTGSSPPLVGALTCCTFSLCSEPQDLRLVSP